MKKYWPYIFYLILTLGIMLPLYRSGFVFLLDMVFVPKMDLSDFQIMGMPSHLPLLILVKLFSAIFSVQVTQKLILTLLWFLPPVFMFRLTKTYLPLIWAFVSGLIYMLNPWTYERFLSGQWYVLLGYAFFPLFIKLSINLLEIKTKKSFMQWLSLLVIYPMISIHWFYIAVWIFILTYLFYIFYQKRKIFTFRSLIKAGLVVVVVFSIINSYWLINFFHSGNTYREISFNDFQAYPTAIDAKWGVYFNVLSLYGFWNHDYKLTKDVFMFWWIPTILYLIFTVIGTVEAIKKRNIFLVLMAILFIPLLVVSVGITGNSGKIIEFLFHYLPGFKGFRETAKLISLLGFTYALLVPLAGKKIAEFTRTSLQNNFASKAIIVIFIAVPLFSVYTIFWGFFGRIKPADYPGSWYQADRMLVQNQKVNKVLFLPWYAYLRLPFANKVLVANPAKYFFESPVISGANIENLKLPAYGQTEIDNRIKALVSGETSIDDEVNYLKQQGITHIILVDEEDRFKYTFLDRTDQLKKIFEQPDLIIYEIN